MIITMQPNKNTPIPAGATHWQSGYCAPFVKVTHSPCDAYTAKVLQDESQGKYLPQDITNIDRTCCYRLVDGQWMIERRQVFSPERNAWEEESYRPIGRYETKRTWREDRVVALQDYEIPAQAARVNTIHGMGTIVGTDQGRPMVELDNNPYPFRPCCLSPSEVW